MSIFNELKRRNVLRVAAAYIVGAWLLIQVVETIFPAFGFGDTVVRITVIVLAIIFLPVLVFAWVFELTPAGLKRENEVERIESISPQTGKTLDRIIMISLAIGIGYFAFDRFVLSEQREETARQEGRNAAFVESYGDTSIAVLPFENMSEDPNNEYFSDGITEEILNLLAQIPQLRVVSRSSSFAFKGKEIHIPDVATRLNVAHVLEGSVRKSGNLVRITAQLIHGSSDSHIWSATYDRPLDNIFEVQDDIAGKVTEAMRLTLVDGPPTAIVTDPEAHEFYLQGLHVYNRRTASDYDKAIEYFKTALEIDSRYAPAWTMLGATYVIQADIGSRPFSEGYELGLEASEHALEIDPDSALVLRAWIAMMYERDFVLAGTRFRRALELFPNEISAVSNGAAFATIIGRAERGAELFNRASKLDPTNSISYVNIAQLYNTLGLLDAAERAATKALEMNPDVYGALAQLAITNLLRGEPHIAIEQAKLIKLDKLKYAVLSMARHELGEHDESDRQIEFLVQNHANRYAYYIALSYAWRQENDAAFKWLERAISERQELDALKVETIFSGLHSDPRWEHVLMDAGLADSQVGAIEI